MKLNKIMSFILATASTVALAGGLSACETNTPEVEIKISFNEKSYTLNYELNRKITPKTVEHFLTLAEKKYYDGFCVHNYSTSKMYTGAYKWENEQLVYQNYYDTVKSYIPKSVWQDEAKTIPTYTLYGEFEENKFEVASGSLKESFGSLVMYYSDKGEDVSVSISKNDDEGTIHYTLDGSEPSLESAVYSGSIKLEATTTIKAKVNALSKMNIENVDCELLKSPNNILGIEYTKAIITKKSKLDIYPIIREGAAYNDVELYKGISSASAIRNAIAEGKIKKTKDSLPSFVYNDLPTTLPNCDDLIFYSVLKDTKQDLKNVIDCTEGLENRIKALSKTSSSLEELKDKLKTKRYTYTRISRILLSSMLGIEESFIRKCLGAELYLKVLAINKEKASFSYYIKSKS